MAQLDITLTIYSDKDKSNQVARINLYAGSAVNYNIFSCWQWASDRGFTVHNPSIYDPRYKEDFRRGGTDVAKSQIVKWLNEDIFSTCNRQRVDGASVLGNYPEHYIFNIILVDWS